MDSSFDRTVLTRLPLAEAVLTLMRWMLDHTLLNSTYDDHRGRCHTRVLTFPAFVQLLFDCLTHPWVSARAALVKARDEKRLPVSLKAFYNKLKNTPVAVSLGLFRQAAARLHAVTPDYRPGCPASLQPLTTLLMDGKVVKHVCRRLKALRRDRGTACKLLGPRSLVLANRWTGQVHDLEADLDGEANEVKYATALLQRLKQTVRGAWLVVADRAFGIFQVCQAIRQAPDGHFLLRKHGQTTFVADPERPALSSTDRFGRPVVQRWGWIVRGKETAGQDRPQIAVRQITVQRQRESLVLLCSLLDADAYPVEDLLDTYLARWDIEGIFQKVTEVFHLRSLFSSSPQGMLLQLVLTLLMYNVVQSVQQTIAQEHDVTPQQLSTAVLFRDIQEELVTLTRLLNEEAVVAQVVVFASAAEVRAYVHGLLKPCWCERWKKANYRPRDPSKPVVPKPTRIRQRKGHDSVQRILQRCRE